MVPSGADGAALWAATPPTPATMTDHADVDRPPTPTASGLPAPLVRICFASRDGQARKIAGRLVERLGDDGVAVDMLDLVPAPPVAEAVDGASLVVVVAAVLYGKHLKDAQRFLAAYQQHAETPPLALASVNLTARKPGKRTAETNPYLRKLIARLGLQPVATAVFAGRLNYPAYRWSDRQIIRFIMLVTGGPTDGKSVFEYTDWPSVDAFAAEIRAALPSIRA